MISIYPKPKTMVEEHLVKQWQEIFADSQEAPRNITERCNNNFDWQVDEKIKLVLTDNEEWARSRGFMKQVKERWNEECPQKPTVSKQNLTDNAKRFGKDQVAVNAL